MSGVVPTKFSQMVPNGQLEECIAFLEEGLESLRPTMYHQVLGRDFLGQKDDLGNWIADFRCKADAAKVGLEALYLEMNAFTINPDQWHCNMFGYKTAGDAWDLDWLAEWDAEHPDCFVLRGMEPVQWAFAESFDDKQPLSVQLSAEITEHLVTARFMQLVAVAYEHAKPRLGGLKGMPVLATAHDWDTVHKIF